MTTPKRPVASCSTNAAVSASRGISRTDGAATGVPSMRRTSSANSLLRRDSSSPTRAPCNVGMVAFDYAALIITRAPTLRLYTRMQGRSDMAKRRFAVLFTVLGLAVFLSMAGFALLYIAFVRAPSVPTDATLVLRVGGDLQEMAPADVVGYLRGVR